MPEYKLYYFSRVHRGRAEGIRLLLNYKGIPFEDVRISFEEWPSKMSSFKFRQLPVLEVYGTQISDTWSILRYLGNKYDLAGKDEDEKVKIDQISELYRDMYKEMWPYIGAVTGFEKGDIVCFVES